MTQVCRPHGITKGEGHWGCRLCDAMLTDEVSIIATRSSIYGCNLECVKSNTMSCWRDLLVNAEHFTKDCVLGKTIVCNYPVDIDSGETHSDETKDHVSLPIGSRFSHLSMPASHNLPYNCSIVLGGHSSYTTLPLLAHKNIVIFLPPNLP